MCLVESPCSWIADDVCLPWAATAMFTPLVVVLIAVMLYRWSVCFQTATLCQRDKLASLPLLWGPNIRNVHLSLFLLMIIFFVIILFSFIHNANLPQKLLGFSSHPGRYTVLPLADIRLTVVLDGFKQLFLQRVSAW